MTARPCLDCGKLSRNNRCPDHDRQHRQREMRRRQQRPKTKLWKSPVWGRVSKQVLMRDNHTCVHCGRHKLELHANERLVADHLHYEDPFNADTCQTLCSTCSGRKDGAKAHPVGSRKNYGT